MKLLKFACLSMIFFTFIAIAGAQKIEETKVVIVEKTTDNNGNVVTHRVTKTGEDAKKYVMEQRKEEDIDVRLEGETKTIRKEVEINISDENTKKSKHVLIKVLDDDGEEKLMEWDGEGEMPEEMKEYINEEGIDIDISESDNNSIRVEATSKNQAILGVIPENHVDGVQILDIIKGSVADKAGLEKGDVIFKINEKTVGSTLQLKDRLSKIKSGEKASISYMRNGESKSITVKL